MQSPLDLVAAVTIMAVLAACGGESIAPASCNNHPTTASYFDAQSVTGTVTSVSLVKASRTIPTPEIVQMAVPGSSISDIFTVTASTAVFERVGSSPPNAVSACQIAIGQQIQISNGFGDFLPPAGRVSANIHSGASDVEPAIVDQVVILR